MQLYLAQTHYYFMGRPLSRISTMAVVCVLLLSVRFGEISEASEIRERASGVSLARSEDAVEGSHGPTVILSYSEETFGKNPVSSFMYFIPLISTTLVDRETSANNAQEVGLVSYERKITAKSFYVACEFEIRGKGFHKNTFDPSGMIAERLAEMPKRESMTHVLDYIKFEGEGTGRIEVRGTIRNAMETVTAVDLQFNVRGRKSPVTIGLYDIKPEDEQYRYENRSNELVARVNTLAFRKSDTTPRMGVSVASISRASTRDGFISRVKGAIANLFIKPPKIDNLGNETMLNFGYAIFKQEPEFTFPIAKNIKEESSVADTTAGP
jgi:hypothetical protein